MILEENFKGLASMVYKCFGKQTNSLDNQRMASKLHKRIARKIRKKTYFRHQQTMFGMQDLLLRN